MGWDMDINHCMNDFLINTVYWFQLSEDLCFDPLLLDYIHHAASICMKHPVPDFFPMLAKNMPGACEPRLL